jgi:hypothetical protein
MGLKGILRWQAWGRGGGEGADSPCSG